MCVNAAGVIKRRIRVKFWMINLFDVQQAQYEIAMENNGINQMELSIDDYPIDEKMELNVEEHTNEGHIMPTEGTSSAIVATPPGPTKEELA